LARLTPWRDFSHNRNAALKECVGKGDYILIFDADDEIQGDLSLPELTHDAYYLQMSDENQSIKYYRRLIIKNNGSYQWKGVLHEFLDHKNEHTVIIPTIRHLSNRIKLRGLVSALA